jgi:hypothetical protein
MEKSNPSGPAKKRSEKGVPLDPGNVSESGTPACNNTSIRTGLNRNFDFALWHLCEYTPTQMAQCAVRTRSPKPP